MGPADWTAGYRADVNYVFGYYPELNPLRTRLALLNKGFAPPNIASACELGFGQGLSVNIHAAASETAWWGNDFNPSQAAFAQDVAAASKSGAILTEDSFRDFLERPDLPHFDFVGLHGIWSWISDANRSVIVDLLRTRLKPGGVLYISYNTAPGWSPIVPLRRLLSEHAETATPRGADVLERVGAAVEFAERLFATEPTYLKANPQLSERLQKLKAQDRHYLAHEYFNQHWQPMPVLDVAEWLSAAKLSFACSAHLLDHVDGVNLTAPQQAFMNDVNEPIFREFVRDLMVNQQFRRDYWVKGARRLEPFERAEALRAERFILATTRSAVSLKAVGSLGEADLHAEVYDPILDLLADHKPHSIGEIADKLPAGQAGLPQVVEAMVVLTSSSQVMPVQMESATRVSRAQTDRFNTYMEHRARFSGEAAFLASPVTGGGVGVSRFEQLFLGAIAEGRKTPAEWAQVAWDVIASQGQKIVKDGQTLDSKEENLAELGRQADLFANGRLGMLTALGIAAASRK